jgi:hypothetical protein
MFDPNSRYFKSQIVEVETGRGKGKTSAVALRRLPYTEGELTQVSGSDRLDITAHRRYKDGTRYWHIADANTELEANTLVRPRQQENPLSKQETSFVLIPKS